MKYIILKASPVIEQIINQRGSFEYKVTHWDVDYKQWDGYCMCTMESRSKILYIDGLSYTRGELIAELKKAI